MRVTQHAIGMAVLKEFRDFRVLTAGGVLTMSDLTEAWQKTGLRTRDLPIGIRWLEMNHCLRVEDSGEQEEILVRLLPAGVKRIEGFPSGISGLIKEMWGAHILRKASRRTHRKSDKLRGMRVAVHKVRLCEQAGHSQSA